MQSHPDLEGLPISQLHDTQLHGIGEHLDVYRFKGDPTNWRQFAKQRFSDFFPSDNSYRCDERLREISLRGDRNNGRCGYELLKTLGEYNASVESLVQALRDVGLHDALQHILPAVEPSIAVQPQDVSAQLGDFVTFTVEPSANVYPPVCYAWYEGSGDSWEPIPNRVARTLRLKVVESHRELQYACNISNRVGHINSDAACINVVELSVAVKPETARVRAGHSATFKCRVEGDSSEQMRRFQWYRNGRVVAGEYTSNLVMDKVESDQQGRYTCHVTFPDRPPVKSNEAVLSVVFPPVFTENCRPDALNFTLRSNQVLSVQCRAMSGLTLVYKWYRDNTCISTKTHDGELELQSITEDESGSYQCRVSYQEYTGEDEMESRSEIWNVNVQGARSDLADESIQEEQIEPPKQESDVSMQAHDESVAMASPQDGRRFPTVLGQATTPAVDSPIALNSSLYRVSPSLPRATGSQLFQEVSGLSPEDKCKPSITQQPEGDMEFSSNSQMKLSVRATGVPVPTYEWLFNGQPLRNPPGNTADLVVNDFHRDRAGVYVCVVQNSCGRVMTKDIVVKHVEVPGPSIRQKPKCPDGGVQAGGDFEMSFRLDDEENIGFQWFRQRAINTDMTRVPGTAAAVIANDPEILPKAVGPTLKVQKANQSFVYWCRATGSNGFVVTSLPVTVNVNHPVAGNGSVSSSPPPAASGYTDIAFSGQTVESRGAGQQTDLVMSARADMSGQHIASAAAAARPTTPPPLEQSKSMPASTSARDSQKPPTVHRLNSHDPKTLEDYSKLTDNEKSCLKHVRHVATHGLGQVRIPFKSQPSHLAAGKIALLIANSSYDNFEKLGTPDNDIVDIGDELRKLGYQVLTFRNLTRSCMEEVKRLLMTLLKTCPGAYMFFFYAGHGFEYQREQFLIPVDAPPGSTKHSGDSSKGNALVENSIRFQKWQHDLSMIKAQIHVAVLDCCRTKITADCQLKDVIAAQSPNWIVFNSCLSSKSAGEERHKSHSLFAQRFLACLAPYTGTDRSFGDEENPPMPDIQTFFKTVRFSMDGPTSQDSVIQDNSKRSLSLADPVVITDGLSVVEKFTEDLHATFKDTTDSGEPRVFVRFRKYMTNCVMAYCEWKDRRANTTMVKFLPDSSKMDGAQCSTAVSDPQRQWFIGTREGNSSRLANSAVHEPALMLITNVHCLEDNTEDMYIELQFEQSNLPAGQSPVRRLPVVCVHNMLLKDTASGMGSLCLELHDRLKQTTNCWSYRVQESQLEPGKMKQLGLTYVLDPALKEREMCRAKARARQQPRPN